MEKTLVLIYKHWVYGVCFLVLALTFYGVIRSINIADQDVEFLLSKDVSLVRLTDKFWGADKLSDYTLAVNWSVTVNNLTDQKSNVQVFCDYTKDRVRIDQIYSPIKAVKKSKASK